MTDNESIVKRLYPDAKLCFGRTADTGWVGHSWWIERPARAYHPANLPSKAWDEAAKEVRNG